MAFEIVPSSPQAAEFTEAEKEPMYPFDSLGVGQSFSVPFSYEKWKSLRTSVSQRNNRVKNVRDGVKFAFIIHKEMEVYEVARIS